VEVCICLVARFEYNIVHHFPKLVEDNIARPASLPHNVFRLSKSSRKEHIRYFHRRVAAWGKLNCRDFPWRGTDNPYHILLAEMMLRRTNAQQVVPTYLEFIREYSDPESLATAPTRQVINALRPIGLKWRARNILKMAKKLSREFDCRVPSNYESLRRLPGVGDYVASAVCSFAFNKPMPVIDTNTVRVVGRYFGFPTHAESRRHGAVRELVAAVTGKRNVRAFNLAFLDFAALVCKAISPKCSACPLRQRCDFGQKRLKKTRGIPE
jgi:A/G-specific adenine glycosylase